MRSVNLPGRAGSRDHLLLAEQMDQVRRILAAADLNPRLY
jgi:hypothetical protein